MQEIEARVAAVANTGPIISAFQCQRFDLVERYFFPIYLPASVQQELEAHGAKQFTDDLIEAGSITVQELMAAKKEQAFQIAYEIAASPLSRVKDADQHIPEAEAIVLFQRVSLNAQMLLVDELAAREVAASRIIRLLGFPGILRTACIDGLIDGTELRRLLEECQRKGTYYSNAFINQLCESVGR